MIYVCYLQIGTRCVACSAGFAVKFARSHTHGPRESEAEPLEPSQGSDSEVQQHMQSEQLLDRYMLGGLELIKLIGESNQRFRIENENKKAS